ncbi:VOC family protein [Nocardia camponoti]|uniref:Glyoxalase-like domain-containing protein n=1 Tax=Nocardia camponoti TaxID=1616106 RepID=A0A917V8K5_9NOCA|nr:VOC family protein [Nocardia camponoti]GGK50494.1 hypothetical protein GCM10011591_22550 [Nocardia camponoti]
MSDLDHLVLATPDFETTLATITRQLGVEPVEGGRHDGRGTRNYLLGLGGDDVYLEIIGPDETQPEPARPRPFGIDTLTEAHLAGWVARTSDIEGALSRAAKIGFPSGEATDMSRTRPDGVTLNWRIALRDFKQPVEVVPFLIDWGASEHPAAALPQAKLVSFSATHPAFRAVNAVLKTFDTSIALTPGIRPTLIATIEGPAGTLTLT